MAEFNHAYELNFEVLSKEEDASDVTANVLRISILTALGSMSDKELLQACNRFDTIPAEVDPNA